MKDLPYGQESCKLEIATAPRIEKWWTVQSVDGLLRRNQLGPGERKVRPISAKVKFINRVAGRVQIL